jgi:hypothetical protein
MTRKHDVFDRFGNKIDEDRPLRDGERVKVGVLLMDHAPPDLAEISRLALADAGDGPLHRPGPARISDAATITREGLYGDRCDRLSDAWRTPPAQDAPAPITPASATAADVDAARALRDKRLEDAWKGAAA